MSLITIAALYSALFILSPLLSTKVIGFDSISIMAGMPLAVLAYSLLDVVNERWGKDNAKHVVHSAIIVRAICWGLGYLSGIPILQEGFRIAMAGELQLFFGQRLVSINLFDYLKQKFNINLSYRYNISAIFSRITSLIVFVVAANAFTSRPIISVILGGLMLRLILNVILTPVVTVLVRILPILIILSLPVNSQASDLKYNGSLRLMAGEHPTHPYRLETGINLNYKRLWVANLFILDKSFDTLKRLPEEILNNKLTVGARITNNLSVVAQRQDITDKPGVTRFGFELRLP